MRSFDIVLLALSGNGCTLLVNRTIAVVHCSGLRFVQVLRCGCSSVWMDVLSRAPTPRMLRKVDTDAKTPSATVSVTTAKFFKCILLVPCSVILSVSARFDFNLLVHKAALVCAIPTRRSAKIDTIEAGFLLLVCFIMSNVQNTSILH